MCEKNVCSMLAQEYEARVNWLKRDEHAENEEYYNHGN